jgi:hypothetical protein
VPVTHSHVVSHQPQPVSGVHVSQASHSAHGSAGSHSVTTYRQSSHVPTAGPPESPVTHSHVVSHHPQPDSPAQASHARNSAQGSVDSHALDTHRQSSHVPVVGPLDVPVMHSAVASHQPHQRSAVHVSQASHAAQGSAGSQSLTYQRQSSQVPVVGPVPVPLMHDQVLSHQPQPPSAVHVSQASQPAQGSTVTHSSAYHRQSSHVPLDGPTHVPSMHVPSASHQPQAAVPTHSSQAAGVAQGSSPGQSSTIQTQSSHVPPVGPPESPLMQAPSVSHQPQPACTVHDPQAVASAQGSGAAHSLGYHRQSSHVPSVGPSTVPEPQAPVAAHQPQGYTAVHASQAP